MTVRGPEMLLPSRVFLFFQNKVLFLLKFIFIHDEPLLLATLHYLKRPLAGTDPEGGRSMEIFASKVRIFT